MMRTHWIAAGALLSLVACSEKKDTRPVEAEPAEAAAKTPAEGEPAEAAAADEGALLDVSKATLTAPKAFTVKFATTKGDILLDVHRDWAPHGADRFYNLVKAGYYDDTAFFRVIGGFMAQVGISGRPEVNEVWRNARFPDDPVIKSNEPGYVTFAAASMPNSRTTQIFINFGDNKRLDAMRFAPFAKVQDASMEVVRKLHAGYGEGAPMGKGPAQGRLQAEGNGYLKKEFPQLDYIESATVVD